MRRGTADGGRRYLRGGDGRRIDMIEDSEVEVESVLPLT